MCASLCAFGVLAVHGMRMGLQDRGLRTGLYAAMGADQYYVSIASKLRDVVTGQAENVNISRTMLALGYEIEAHGDPKLSKSRYRIVTLRARYICDDYHRSGLASARKTQAARARMCCGILDGFAL
jgi:hypothetical protein